MNVQYGSNIVPPTTKVLSPETVHIISTLSTDRSTRRSKLTFAKSTPEAAGVKVGDVVVADVSNNTRSGFIGNVINVHKSGTVVVIEAGPASLADALTSAQISISRTLTAADMTLGLPLSVSHS